MKAALLMKMDWSMAMAMPLLKNFSGMLSPIKIYDEGLQVLLLQTTEPS
jgi:hypothetical protein